MVFHSAKTGFTVNNKQFGFGKSGFEVSKKRFLDRRKTGLVSGKASFGIDKIWIRD